MSNSFLYQTTRVFGSSIFKNKFNPKIINKEEIPNDGPLILCGNHMNALDPFILMVSTKRTIHFLLDRDSYDENSKSLLKMMGMASTGDVDVDEAMISYLKKNGCICFFPEEERNFITKEELHYLYDLKQCNVPFDEFEKLIDSHTLLSQIKYLEKLYNEGIINIGELKLGILHAKSTLLELVEKEVISKEDYDDSLILPFSTKAVKIAKQTGAFVVPFAVNGDYAKLSDNLVIRFGKGFIVKPNDDIEEVNNFLRDNVKKMVKENTRIKF